MQEYLGETPVQKSESPFKEYTQSDWAMYFIERYGQIDGSHHKTWVLDQVSRLLKGTQVEIVLARWKREDGTFLEEYRVWTVDTLSQQYIDWVVEMKGSIDEDGDFEYDYDEGIAP